MHVNSPVAHTEHTIMQFPIVNFFNENYDEKQQNWDSNKIKSNPWKQQMKW